MTTLYVDRPTCAQVVAQFDSWNIKFIDLKSLEIYDKYLDNMENFFDKFFFNYFMRQIVYC